MDEHEQTSHPVGNHTEGPVASQEASRTDPGVVPTERNAPIGRSAPAGRLVVLVAIVALLAGSLGGGIAGGVAGYAISSMEDEPAATATPLPGADRVSTDATPQADQTLSDVVARVNPAVVTIRSQIANTGGLFGQGGTASGSGFIIDDSGHIVTNNHVVEGAASLTVVFSDGTETDATLVGADPFQDVAVIKVDVPVPATVSFGDSDQLRPGDPVIAIGSALGEFTNSVTNGIVSATNRSLDTGEGYRLDNLIQHNAPISPGNSGGPLIDMQGLVVGMNTAVVRGSIGQSAEGLGFAVAGNVVKEIAERIIETGSANRPYIGITFTDARAFDPQATGVVIQEVAPNSPAAQAGLEPGDIITAVNGVAIDDEHPFLNLMLDHQPGDTVELTVDRGSGKTETLSVTLGERPA